MFWVPAVVHLERLAVVAVIAQVLFLRQNASLELLLVAYWLVGQNGLVH